VGIVTALTRNARARGIVNLTFFLILPQLSLPVTLAGAGVAGDRTVGYQTSLVLLQIYIDHNIGNGDLTSFVRSYRLTGVCVSSHRIAREHS
jgi:hypothetical protein